VTAVKPGCCEPKANCHFVTGSAAQTGGASAMAVTRNADAYRREAVFMGLSTRISTPIQGLLHNGRGEFRLRAEQKSIGAECWGGIPPNADFDGKSW